MHYLLISFTHKNTDIKVREKLSMGDEKVLLGMYHNINAHPQINESIIFSTCNRVEIFCSVKKCESSIEHIFNLLAEFSGLDANVLQGYADTYEDHGAIHHLFCVASSLDSIVIGETQIVGQLKDALKVSYDNGFCSQKLIRAMHFAFRCSSAVRNCTDISKSPVSISSVAVAQAKELMGGNLGGHTAVVVGAGEMARLAAKHLIASGVNVIVINRTEERAKILCSELGDLSEYRPYSELESHLNRHRLLFTATGAMEPIIYKEMVQKREYDRYWFDIAVPRDIAQCECENIHVYTVDDLQEIVSGNMALREEQSKKAYGVIGMMTMEFFKWLQSLSFEPLIKEIREKAKECSQKEIDRAIKKGFIPREHEEAVMKIVHAAFNGFLHTPTIKLKEIAEKPESDTIIESVKYIFDLKSEKHPMNMYRCEYHMGNNLITKENSKEHK